MRATPPTMTAPETVRQWLEAEEQWRLSPRRGLGRRSRAVGPGLEPESEVRTAFQRDRDRIIHSKSFRRLKHKTQVFIAPVGDHLPHAADSHAGSFTDRADARPRAAAQRGPGRGDHAGPRRRPYAVRALRRACARSRCCRVDFATTCRACGPSSARKGWPGPQPDRRGARWHSWSQQAARRAAGADRLAGAGHARRVSWSSWPMASPISTTILTMRRGRGCCNRRSCQPRRSPCWARRMRNASIRWSWTSCGTTGGSRRPTRRPSPGDASIGMSPTVLEAANELRDFMFDHIYHHEVNDRQRDKAERLVTALFATSPAIPTSCLPNCATAVATTASNRWRSTTSPA